MYYFSRLSGFLCCLKVECEEIGGLKCEKWKEWYAFGCLL